ncbi:MAG: MraY family glycosyltransferase [Clostridium perfringens]|nr:MraY family glycosyltransferase [Clostridium perfringens]
MVNYLFILISSFLIACALMIPLIKLSIKFGFTDKPKGRKKHNKPISLIGGVPMFISFFLVYLIFIDKITYSKESVVILITSFMIFAIGLLDDYNKTKGIEFPIIPRFTIQIISSIVIYKSGIVFRGFTNPVTGNYIILPNILQLILTITWIFGVTTVINWIDGIDGLAGAIVAISSTTMFIVAFIKGENAPSSMSIALLGITLAFLIFNRYPAKVFMGDSGANFLGFILSIIALEGAFKQTTALSILIPILILGVPIFDNLFVVLKRMKEKKPIYKADRSQVHYRLLEKGLTVNQTVLYLCTLSIFLSFISILIFIFKL